MPGVAVGAVFAAHRYIGTGRVAASGLFSSSFLLYFSIAAAAILLFSAYPLYNSKPHNPLLATGADEENAGCDKN